jgi:hypothetical protein
MSSAADLEEMSEESGAPLRPTKQYLFDGLTNVMLQLPLGDFLSG